MRDMGQYRLPPKLNKKIGKAMHDYSMFEEGDKVLIAVSGGVDSLVLACVLKTWQQKMPFKFDLTAYHIDHGFWQRTAGVPDQGEAVGKQLKAHGIRYEIITEREIAEETRTCFLCSRNRRNQLFDIAKAKGFTKIALGHHKDDLIETFFLNAIYSGNLSTMVPKQNLFEGTLSIVRPLAYLEKIDVQSIANDLQLDVVKNFCPLSDNTRREKVRAFLDTLYTEEPRAKKSLFASLSNVRKDYLL